MWFGFRHIINPHWGEQVHFFSNDKISLALSSQGLDKQAEAAVWAPFVKWVKSQPKHFKITIHFDDVLAQNMWRYDSDNSAMILNSMPGAPKG